MNRKIESLIGILGLGGGYLGFTITLQYLIQTKGILSTTISLIFCALYAIGIFVGYKLITEKNELTYRLNLYFWLIQTIAIYSPGITYFFSAGAFLIIGSNISLNFQFGSKFDFYILSFKQPFILYVNLIAVYFSWFLNKKVNAFSKKED